MQAKGIRLWSKNYTLFSAPSIGRESRAENPGIRKEKDELGLDSWMQIRSTGWDERK